MKTVTIEVSTPEKNRERLFFNFDDKEQGNYISFPDTESLWKTFTPVVLYTRFNDRSAYDKTR